MIREFAVALAAVCLATACPVRATVIGFDDLKDSVTVLQIGRASCRERVS
jgi:hypothetical protein